MSKLEQRFLSELRYNGQEAPTRLTGYAARYGAIADLGRYQERIEPFAFAHSVSRSGTQDILALLDHDPSKVLGRTKTNTLSLRDTEQGLHFDIEVPDTSAGRDALALAQRGDLGGASIGFIVEEERRDEDVRVIERARLLEISIVSAWPAYAETSVEARRLGPPVQPAFAETGHEARRLGLSPTLQRAPRLAQLQRFLETV